MKRFFKELITKKYRFNALLIMLEADMLIICSVLLMFIENNAKLVKNTIIIMCIGGLVLLVTMLQTLNKMKKIRIKNQMIQLEDERQQKVKEREAVNKESMQ